MNRNFNESDTELATISWIESEGYNSCHGQDISPEGSSPERDNFTDVVLKARLETAVNWLNPKILHDAKQEAIRKVLCPDNPSLTQNNRNFHRMLVNGVEVEYRRTDGSIAGDWVRLIDFENPDNNDWLVVNQFTVIENNKNRRPDVVVFVNGLPLVVIELKNPADKEATIWAAFNQLQTYKRDIPSLFNYNELLIISDGLEARFGSLTANKEWFLPWKAIEGDELTHGMMTDLEVLIKGMFDKKRFLDIIRYFILFEDNPKGSPVKKIAGYHQYHAVNKAVETAIAVTQPDADHKGGVVWHTQGSGKSLTMLFFAGKIILQSEMKNPTLVMLTDRNDLDDQLFGTFSRSNEIIRQKPAQIDRRADLREYLNVASGGVVFTTIQKFFPEDNDDEFPMLSDRNNIIVIADEAHRSQYGFKAHIKESTGDRAYGFAKYVRDALPNATFVGFTGTPIELTDKNTRAVFGDYISVYDIEQAVKDKATVRIYYESRLAQLELNEDEKPHIDPDFEEVTETEEPEYKEKLKTKWAAMEKIVGADKRINMIAEDLVDHWESRLEAMDGKAMIVCMSRRICVDLYNALVNLRPNWHRDDDDKGIIKVVMTGSPSDPENMQPHVRNKKRREDLATRFKDADSEFRIVILRDMWLTGFDVPSLHTMYVDKPMRGHGLMQAIARVNRVFKDKPGGLIVDYIGIADPLKKALAVYTESGGKGETTVDQDKAVQKMLEKYEICCDMFHGFDWDKWKVGTAVDRLSLLPPAQEHILQQDNGQSRYNKVVTELSVAFALSIPNVKAIAIRDDVSFFQAVKAALVKKTTSQGQKTADFDQAIRQIVSRAITPDGVIDIFQEAGLQKPDISILSDEFLNEVQGMPHKNLAVELLNKLLREEIRIRSRKNVVKGRSFLKLLEKSMRSYQNRAIETAKVIEELIALAKEIREADRRGEDLGLTEDELAFYDALETNDSAVKVLGDAILKQIALDLVEIIRRNVNIDWTVRGSIKAKLRAKVKRTLRKHGYPPDKTEKATETVLQQAEVIALDWAV